jgi:hypothetical protein
MRLPSDLPSPGAKSRALNHFTDFKNFVPGRIGATITVAFQMHSGQRNISGVVGTEQRMQKLEVA